MISPTDIEPIAGTVGGGFFGGMLVGYALKKVIRLVAIIFGLFVAALAYMEYQGILNVDWTRIQVVSQNGITWVTNAITNISNTLGSPHSGTLSHVGIPLVSSASAGLMLGLARG